jgi:hypothetical protein
MIRPNFLLFDASLLHQKGLRTSQKNTEFIDDSFDQFDSTWSKHVTERMRALDDTRMRTPTQSECQQLNIPGDRLNIHNTSSILLLCGGCVGVRFTTDEIQKLVSITTSCETLYKTIENAYKALPQSFKIRRLKGPYNEQSEKIDNNVVDSIFSLPSLPPCCSNHPEDIDAVEIIKLHCAIDSYLKFVIEIQELVKLKNSSILSQAERSLKGDKIIIMITYQPICSSKPFIYVLNGYRISILCIAFQTCLVYD